VTEVGSLMFRIGDVPDWDLGMVTDSSDLNILEFSRSVHENALILSKIKSFEFPSSEFPSFEHETSCMLSANHLTAMSGSAYHLTDSSSDFIRNLSSELLTAAEDTPCDSCLGLF
jgi:hypothetical protein